jgi:ABC-type transporter Mla MlaB component
MFNYFLEMKASVLVLTLKGVLYPSDMATLKWLLGMAHAQCRKLEINLQNVLCITPECLALIRQWTENAQSQGADVVISSQGKAAAERFAVEASVAEARQLEFLLECRRQKPAEKSLAD